LRVSSASATVFDEAPALTKTDASLAAVFLARDRLLVQVKGPLINNSHPLARGESLTDRLSVEHHLELWLGSEPAHYGCPGGWDGLHPPLYHWKIRLADGQVLSMSDSEPDEITALALTAPGRRDTAVLEIALPREVLSWGITLGLSQVLGEGKRRLIATSPIVPGDPFSLGAVGGLPRGWECTFEDGILNVTHVEPEPWIEIPHPDDDPVDVPYRDPRTLN
jgi:hypothetical protein